MNLFTIIGSMMDKSDAKQQDTKSGSVIKDLLNNPDNYELYGCVDDGKIIFTVSRRKPKLKLKEEFKK